MLPGEDIQQALAGAWRLMNGKADGLRLLDLSADGFWNSFFAMVVASPARLVFWVAIAAELAKDPEAFSSRLSILAGLAVIEVGVWTIPILALALVAPRAGLGNRFVAYVVASNWGSALIAWLMMPAALVWLFLPQARDFANLFSLFLFGVSLILTWRLTNAVIARGAAIGSAVFIGMLTVSLLVQFALQWALGIYF
jgi:hypothetical protein